MPVPGTGTFVWWEHQIDPTLRFGIPMGGWRTPDGKFGENNQLEPDIKVAQRTGRHGRRPRSADRGGGQGAAEEEVAIWAFARRGFRNGLGPRADVRAATPWTGIPHAGRGRRQLCSCLAEGRPRPVLPAAARAAHSLPGANGGGAVPPRQPAEDGAAGDLVRGRFPRLDLQRRVGSWLRRVGRRSHVLRGSKQGWCAAKASAPRKSASG